MINVEKLVLLESVLFFFAGNASTMTNNYVALLKKTNKMLFLPVEGHYEVKMILHLLLTVDAFFSLQAKISVRATLFSKHYYYLAH